MRGARSRSTFEGYWIFFNLGLNFLIGYLQKWSKNLWHAVTDSGTCLFSHIHILGYGSQKVRVLIWKFSYQKDEWEMIAEKGSKWIKNLPAGVKYKNVLEVAATTVSVTIYLMEIKTVPRVVIAPKENLQFLLHSFTELLGIPDRWTFKCLILSFVKVPLKSKILDVHFFTFLYTISLSETFCQISSYYEHQNSRFLDLYFREFTAAIDFPCSKFWLRIRVNDVILSKIPHGLKL